MILKMRKLILETRGARARMHGVKLSGQQETIDVRALRSKRSRPPALPV
jgi:hypothetical protein